MPRRIINTAMLPQRRPRRRSGASTITSHSRTICSLTGKLRYRDRHQAVDALNSARRQRAYELAHFGSSTREETRIYRCADSGEGGCGGFHATSIPCSVRRGAAAAVTLQTPKAVSAAIHIMARASGLLGVDEVAA